jgi:hypothetical protein
MKTRVIPRCRARFCDAVLLEALVSKNSNVFLCPRCRAGLCNRVEPAASPLRGVVSIPRCRAGLCNIYSKPSKEDVDYSFYALGVGLGFATREIFGIGPSDESVSMPSVSGWALQREVPIQGLLGLHVSMPSVSGWALQPRSTVRSRPERRFYALGVGLGFATDGLWRGL